MAKSKDRKQISTNRLSKEIETALNSQMTKEAQAAQIYLSYAVWADDGGYSGIADFLFRHAAEERNHMMKILQYIQSRGGKAKIEAIQAPPADPRNVNECFHKVFEHEVDNTEAIYKLVNLSMEKGDWATWNFVQWFVKEQIEEESLALDLLDKIKVAGGEKASDDALFDLDRDLKNKPDEEPLARTAEEGKPI
jgi:ferritin